jgi:hypothetical protein
MCGFGNDQSGELKFFIWEESARLNHQAFLFPDIEVDYHRDKQAEFSNRSCFAVERASVTPTSLKGARLVIDR